MKYTVLILALICSSMQLRSADASDEQDFEYVPTTEEEKLYAAIARNKLSEVEWRLKQVEDPRHMLCHGLKVPMLFGARSADMVHLLVDKGADVSQEDSSCGTPLCVFARDCSVSADAVQALISRGANVNFVDHKGRSALDTAVSANNVGAVYSLLRNGADPEYTQSLSGSLLCTASKSSVDIILMLLLVKLDPNEYERRGIHLITSPLACAAQDGNIPVIQMLLDAGAELNPDPNSTCTALRAAIHGGHADVITFLGAKGATLTSQDRELARSKVGDAQWLAEQDQQAQVPGA